MVPVRQGEVERADQHVVCGAEKIAGKEEEALLQMAPEVEDEVGRIPDNGEEVLVQMVPGLEDEVERIPDKEREVLI